MNSSGALSYKVFSIPLPNGQPDLHEINGPCFWLTSNGAGKNLLALGCADEVILKTGEATVSDALLSKMTVDDWWFGYVSFEFKDCTEPVVTGTSADVSNHLLHFIKPLAVLEWSENPLEKTRAVVHTLLSEVEAMELIEYCFAAKQAKPNPPFELKARTDKQKYLRNASSLMSHIQRGDIYEVNYCIDFFADQALPSPFRLFEALNRNTEAPNAAYFNIGQLFALCCSPESFLKKTGSTVTMKPIKGTKPRGNDRETDLRMCNELSSDAKEKAENIMIVDLVRNDLSKSALPGSVRVSDLCGVYPFKTVWQMISTVSAEVDQKTGFPRLLNDCFPPGSMTGAPKVSALHLIDQHEDFQRGIYSGSIGYVRPGGDFELNVVIRSIVYDASKPRVTLAVGSALTAACSPEDEYEECLLKARALKKVIEHEPVVQ